MIPATVVHVRCTLQQNNFILKLFYLISLEDRAMLKMALATFGTKLAGILPVAVLVGSKVADELSVT